MAKKNNKDDVQPQSQSQPGATNENPNADVADGNQSTSDTSTSGDVPAGGATGGVSVPSDGGNAAANQGGTSAPAGPNQ